MKSRRCMRLSPETAQTITWGRVYSGIFQFVTSVREIQRIRMEILGKIRRVAREGLNV